MKLTFLVYRSMNFNAAQICTTTINRVYSNFRHPPEFHSAPLCQTLSIPLTPTNHRPVLCPIAHFLQCPVHGVMSDVTFGSSLGGLFGKSLYSSRLSEMILKDPGFVCCLVSWTAPPILRKGEQVGNRSPF